MLLLKPCEVKASSTVFRGEAMLVYPNSFLARPVTNEPTLIRLLATQSKLYKDRSQSTFDKPLELFLFDEPWQSALSNFFSPKWFHLIQTREMLTGADVIHKLLSGLNLINAIFHARNQWKHLAKKAPESQSEVIEAQGPVPQAEEEKQRDQSIQQQKDAVLRRITLIRDLLQSQTRPEWMVLRTLPVLPPDLRPILELKDGQLIRSDLNELYRRVLYRNQLICQFSVEDPFCISMMQKKLLQQAIDSLLANGAGGNIIRDRNMRPYKSLSDIIKGKKGRFRENLLGKRVDYSGRSVIVVGPYLSLYQCGLPREMAIELFQPFVIRGLIINHFARNPRAAKSMIQRRHPIVWKILKMIVDDHLVILNRAPTLHRLGVQAFQPVLVRERAIHLHPLVCTGFNADFDGDQMAVHVPLSLEAQAEAHLLMSPYFNLLSPGTGDAIVFPTQDMLLGLYALTLGATLGVYSNINIYTNQSDVSFIQKTDSKIITFSNFSDALTAYHQGIITSDLPIWLYCRPEIAVMNNSQGDCPVEAQYQPKGIYLNVYEHSQIRTDKLGKTVQKYIRTTAGRAVLNQQVEQAIQGTEQAYKAVKQLDIILS